MINIQWSEDLLKKYPKAAANLKSDMKETIEAINHDLIDIVESYFALQLEANPYKITDFFDRKGIYLSIMYEDGKFSPFIDSRDSDEWLPTRREAEKKGVEKMFEILESNLQSDNIE